MLSTVERSQPTLPGVDEVGTVDQPLVDETGVSPVSPRARGVAGPASRGGAAGAASAAGRGLLPKVEQRDTPICYQCGMVMQRAGSCYVCASCGTTSGCS